MNYEKIGEFIALKRKEKNLTQRDLAKKIGVTDKAVSRWETGLGCPDVSILELLSKELDVSILELLKGRKIENEVIKITEADDYIKDSFNVSKDISKRKISNMLFYIIVIISFGFIILSGINYYRSNRGEELFIDEYGYLIRDYKKEKVKLQSNIEKIKNNRGILTSEEQETLVKKTNATIEYMDDLYIFKFDRNKKYTINEIMIYFLDSYESPKYPGNILSPYLNVLHAHDLYNEYIDRAIKSHMYLDVMYKNQLVNYYSYRNLQYFNYKSSNSLLASLSREYIGGDSLNYLIEEQFRTLIDNVELLNLLSNEILKAGGINE